MDYIPPGFLFMRFSRQEYWRGQPFPSPGDLTDLGIKAKSPEPQADYLPLSHQGNYIHKMNLPAASKQGAFHLVTRTVAPPS